jgi:hypothetical protein
MQVRNGVEMNFSMRLSGNVLLLLESDEEEITYLSIGLMQMIPPHKKGPFFSDELPSKSPSPCLSE